MSDSNDVALAVAGDYAAYERLYRSHVGEVYTLCARLSASRARGTALTEEVFVKAWENLSGFSGDIPFAAWLRRLATELALSREGIVGASTFTWPVRSPANEGANAVSGAADRSSLELSQAIDALPPNARGIFVLHDIEGYQYSEVAELFGITIGVTKARLQQARVLLKEALGR